VQPEICRHQPNPTPCAARLARPFAATFFFRLGIENALVIGTTLVAPRIADATLT